MMIIVLLYYGGNIDVDDVSDVGDFDVVIPRCDEDGDSKKTRNDHCKRTRATSLLSKYVCNICDEMIISFSIFVMR